MKTITPDPHATHPIEAIIRLTGSSRRKIIFYWRKGIVWPQTSALPAASTTPHPEESVPPDTKQWLFDEEALIRLRHIETLRQQHRMNWLAIQTIIHLTTEVETLRQELRRRS